MDRRSRSRDALAVRETRPDFAGARPAFVEKRLERGSILARRSLAPLRINREEPNHPVRQRRDRFRPEFGIEDAPHRVAAFPKGRREVVDVFGEAVPCEEGRGRVRVRLVWDREHERCSDRRAHTSDLDRQRAQLEQLPAMTLELARVLELVPYQRRNDLWPMLGEDGDPVRGGSVRMVELVDDRGEVGAC
jgi:hypothetical protein